MISTMRHVADNEFLIQNPDFEKLICFIDADKDFNWLNFKMSDQKKKKLFLLGTKKGLEFIKKLAFTNKSLEIEIILTNEKGNFLHPLKAKGQGWKLLKKY